MNVVDELISLSSGARFFRTDLHMHSFGGSHDVKDATMSPEGIIKTALREQLSVIAITDHNEITNVRGLVALAKGKDLLVIPGVELTTPQGHLLAYFDTCENLEAYYGKLAISDRGTGTSHCQTGMLECLKLMDPVHGFAILAHVDADGGLEKIVPGFPPHKAAIMSAPSLVGLEVKSAQSDISYTAVDPNPQRAELARKRTTALQLGDGQILARVLFSDSHSLVALGKNAQGNRRLTRIKMDSPSFDGIRVALHDADARIRLEDEVPTSVPYILGVKLEGGFLDGQAVHFSRNLNCIIGGRGTGKSTVFEAARTIAPTPTTSKLVDSEVWPGKITIIWVDQAGQQHTIERLIGEDSQNVDDPMLGSTTFPIESYSQAETAETSTRAEENPAVLLQYLDHFVDLGELISQEEICRDELLSNQTAIEKASAQVARIPDIRKQLAATQQQLRVLETANASEIVILERKIAEERSIRDGIDENLVNLRREMGASPIEDIINEIQNAAKLEDLRVGSAEFTKIKQLASDFSADTEKSQQTLQKRAQTLNAEIKKQIDLWKGRERAILSEIEQKKKELAAQGIKLDSMYIKKLAADESSHTKTLRQLSEVEKQLRACRVRRSQLIEARRALRAAVSKERERFAAKANSALKTALTDFAVTVKFMQNAYSPEAEEIVKEAMGWRTSQVPRAALLLEQVPVPALLAAIQKNDPRPLMAVAAPDGTKPFSQMDSLEIFRTLAQPPHIFRLERCVFDDRPKITVTKLVRQKGKLRPISRDFSKLSLGQQQSVLLALMLSSESNAPLIIDQPEDNLDGEFIFQSLVPVLRTAKERRQIIVVTHNANIAVLGDAEQIIALKSTSDKSMVVARGSIDDMNTKAIVCRILEGAEAAFRRRAKMYGIM